jgi:hypothetical protein
MMKTVYCICKVSIRINSVSYRIAMGPQQGQKVFTLQTLPASNEGEYGQLANTSGFSLHAGVFADAYEPEKLERLCRYISRPAISEQHLSMTDHGKVRYELKTPYRDGTPVTGKPTYIFNPLDFIGKLAAIIPPPRLNLTRFGLPASLAYSRPIVIFALKSPHPSEAKIALDWPTKEMSNRITSR